MRRSTSITSVLALIALLSGCQSMPSGPAIAVLPTQGKLFEQFQQEDVQCRSYASQAVDPKASYDLQARYDTVYQQCMYSKGNQLPPPAPVGSYYSGTAYYGYPYYAGPFYYNANYGYGYGYGYRVHYNYGYRGSYYHPRYRR